MYQIEQKSVRTFLRTPSFDFFDSVLGIDNFFKQNIPIYFKAVSLKKNASFNLAFVGEHYCVLNKYKNKELQQLQECSCTFECNHLGFYNKIFILNKYLNNVADFIRQIQNWSPKILSHADATNDSTLSCLIKPMTVYL